MYVNRASNRLPIIHQLITHHYGENYWLNGCLKYVFECLGEKQFDYWFFSGITGDNLAQIYAPTFRGDGVSDYLVSQDYVKKIFDTCGYSCTYVSEQELNENKALYLSALISYIDKGIPVISGPKKEGWRVIIGYEQYGKTLLYMGSDNQEPKSFSSEGDLKECWIFSGAKLREVSEAAIYREIVLDMPRLLTYKTDAFCFGARAFHSWADEVEGGRFDTVKPEEFEQWFLYTVYVCNVATNGSCRKFLERAFEMNPDLTFLPAVIEEYKNLAVLWCGSDGKEKRDTENLESLGGGFNVTLDTLRDVPKRTAIAAKIRECAACCDRLVALISETNMR